MTFRPADDVREALDAERERRPGVSITYLLNETLRAGLRVPPAERPRVPTRSRRQTVEKPKGPFVP